MSSVLLPARIQLKHVLVLFDLIYTKLSVIYLLCWILKRGRQQTTALAVSLPNRRLGIIRPGSSCKTC